jgi:hypothetical protein
MCTMAATTTQQLALNASVISTPFGINRFEYEGTHVYSVRDRENTSLEIPKPALLVGSRGTGKTCLLRSLYWEERLSNPQLKEQLPPESLPHGLIGLYMRMPDFVVNGMHDWFSGSPDLANQTCSLYMELICLQALLDALAKLAASGEILLNSNEEKAIAIKILDDLDVVSRGRYRNDSTYVASTLKDCASTVRRLRCDLQELRIGNVRPVDALRYVALGEQFLSLTRSIAGHVKHLCVKSGQRIYFKICFDECELLSNPARLILNTWLRLAVAPVFPVLSYVRRPADVTSTLLPNLSLNKDDFILISLDETEDSEFNAFAQRVVAIRAASAARIATPNLPNLLRDSLGKLDFDGLFSTLLKVSEKADAITFLDHLKSTKRKLYEQYLIERMKITAPDATADQRIKRKFSSQYFRRRNVAAYLSLCEEFRSEPRYSSSDMFLQTSDCCIRNLLDNLHHLYTESHTQDPSAILNSQFSPDMQNVALRASSKAKFAGISQSGVESPAATSQIVSGLAFLTRRLQRTSTDRRTHLFTPERGVFLLKQSPHTDHEADVVSKLDDAAETGYLKALTPGGGVFKRFRVHTSLAAHFGFSYRGAYAETVLQYDDLLGMLETADPEGIKSLVERIATRIESPITARSRGRPVMTGDLFNQAQLRP